MKRFFSVLLCLCLCVAGYAGTVSAVCLDEDELPGIIVDPDLVLPTRQLRVLASDSWKQIYAYTGKEPFPGTQLPKQGNVYAMSISVSVTELILSDGERQTDPITLDRFNQDLVIVLEEEAALYYGTFGDVTGDGKVNIGDTAKIYSHLRGTNLLTDEAVLLFADATGDGRLNMGDVAKVYHQVKTAAG